MATLTQDTLISTLSLSDGDTIELAGHNLVVDKIMCGSTDPNDTNIGLKITNSGGDCNLEFRDLSGIRLNQSGTWNGIAQALPPTVHPTTIEGTIPASDANHAIDGDAYRTPLTANARVEIQLAGKFSLGGGAASLPTETRSGAFWGICTSKSGGNIVLDRDVPFHVGDMLQRIGRSNNEFITHGSAVLGYDSISKTVTIESDNNNLAGWPVGLVGGGVVVTNTGGAPILSAPCKAGTINLLAPTVGYDRNRTWVEATSGALIASRAVVSSGFSWINSAQDATYFCANNSSVEVGQCFAPFFLSARLGYSGGVSARIGELVCGAFVRSWANDFQANTQIEIENGYFRSLGPGYQSSVRKGEYCGVALSLKDVTIYQNNLSYVGQKMAVCFEDCTIAGQAVSGLVESGGIVTSSESGHLHAPATSYDVTWRYADRTVAPGATLRLRCAWQREGASAKASIAITDTSVWWPSLCPLGADALASVEFAASGAQLLSWRNTSDSPRQVRVWECVTGHTDGGHLQTEEIKGGPL